MSRIRGANFSRAIAILISTEFSAQNLFAGDDGHPSELAKPSCVYRMWEELCRKREWRAVWQEAKICTEGKQSMVGPKVAAQFIWAFQISYLQAYFRLPIISRVLLNSYTSRQNLADDEIASF